MKEKYRFLFNTVYKLIRFDFLLTYLFFYISIHIIIIDKETKKHPINVIYIYVIFFDLLRSGCDGGRM